MSFDSQAALMPGSLGCWVGPRLVGWNLVLQPSVSHPSALPFNHQKVEKLGFC